MIRRALLAGVAAAFAEFPRNDHAWNYTINGFDGSPYINRTLLPRVLGHRLMIHRIFRGDADRWLHNHPWRTAHFLIVSGGYIEEREVYGERVERILAPGDINTINAADFHRIRTVRPDTWTIALVGERCQDWGFQVDGEGFVPSMEFFARKNYQSQGVQS